MDLTFKIVPFDSEEQKATIGLRHDILRAPLGMVFTEEQLAAEKDDFHLASYQEGALVACLVLHEKDADWLKMRQVAVAEKCQRQGIGQQMIEFSHQWAKEKGYKIMFCHARHSAADFYERKLGYAIVGEPFEEVGMKHFRMEKEL